jgi:hypothetical protein
MITISTVSTFLSVSSALWNQGNIEKFTNLYDTKATYIHGEKKFTSKKAIQEYYISKYGESDGNLGKLNIQPFQVLTLNTAPYIYAVNGIFTVNQKDTLPIHGYTSFVINCNDSNPLVSASTISFVIANTKTTSTSSTTTLVPATKMIDTHCHMVSDHSS